MLPDPPEGYKAHTTEVLKAAFEHARHDHTCQEAIEGLSALAAGTDEDTIHGRAHAYLSAVLKDMGWRPLDGPAFALRGGEEDLSITREEMGGYAGGVETPMGSIVKAAICTLAGVFLDPLPSTGEAVMMSRRHAHSMMACAMVLAYQLGQVSHKFDDWSAAYPAENWRPQPEQHEEEIDGDDE